LLYFGFEDERLAGMTVADLGIIVEEYYRLHPEWRNGRTHQNGKHIRWDILDAPSRNLGHNSSEQLVETVYRRLVVVLRLNKLGRAVEFSEEDRQRRSGLKRDHNPDWTDLYSEMDESCIAARQTH
jgi:hypothetical protein